VERKLTAILCADVHGYSRFMRDNEEATVRTLFTSTAKAILGDSANFVKMAVKRLSGLHEIRDRRQ